MALSHHNNKIIVFSNTNNFFVINYNNYNRTLLQHLNHLPNSPTFLAVQFDTVTVQDYMDTLQTCIGYIYLPFINDHRYRPAAKPFKYNPALPPVNTS